MGPNDALRILNALKQQQKTDTTQETAQTKTPDKFALDSYVSSSEEDSSTEGIAESVIVGIVQKTLMLTANYCCECGRLFRAHFKDRVHVKNFDVVMQKENKIFEHVDVKPYIFLVHCDSCNSDTEVRVDNIVETRMPILCRHCTPARGGILDVSTGDAVWFG
jgi:hypothetical protein